MAGERFAVEATFALFRRIFPVRPLPRGMRRLRSEERDMFHRWEIGFLFVFLLGVLPLMAAGWYFGLRGAASLCYPRPAGTTRLVPGGPVLWMPAALFLGIITSAIPLDLLGRALLRDRYPRYTRACDERTGFDGWRSFALIAAVVLPAVAIYCAGAVRMFVRFDAAGLELGRPFRFGTTYYLNHQIRAVEHRASLVAPIGRVVFRSHYVVGFDDGVEWEIDRIYDIPPDGDRELAEYIAARAGLPVVERP